MSRRKWFQMLVVTVVTACLLVFSGMASAQGNRDNAFERVKEVQEQHTQELMAREGVVGTAVGLSEQDRHVVLVLLERPGLGGIPQELEGVPVHPFVTGKIRALKPPKPSPSFDPTKYCNRPVFIGVSTGHPAITAGTIGCRVTDGTDVYALSNNHVYANENTASIGDFALQPGPYDGGGTVAGRDDVIGTLASFPPLDFAGADNTIDAAIVLSSTDKLGKTTPPNGYGTPSSTTVVAYIRQPVQKYGRTTSLTTGKVHAINATVNVGYDSGTAKFVKQIVVSPGTFSAGGDSGSLIVTQSGKNPVGLLFAGSSSVTIANPIDLVLSYFGVTVDGE